MSINLCALLFCAGLQAAPAPSDVKDLETALYLAIPDTQGLLRALQATPGPTFLRSKAIEPLLSFLPGDGWRDSRSLPSELASLLGLPALEPEMAKVSSLSLSIQTSQQQPALLLWVRLAEVASAQAMLDLLLEAWGAESDLGSQHPGLWRAELASLPSLSIWLERREDSLCIGVGQTTAAGFFAAASLANPGPNSIVSRPALAQLASGDLDKLPSAASSSQIWLVHHEDPLRLLSLLDAKHRLFGGVLAELPALNLCAPIGMARLEVSPSGYSLDLFEPGPSNQDQALSPELLNQVAAKSMLVIAGRPRVAELLAQLQTWSAWVGRRLSVSGAAEEPLRQLLDLLADDALVYSNSMNSTSPPKSYLSIGIKPGDAHAGMVLQAFGKLLTALTGYPIAERSYAVRNKVSKERHSFLLHTLVIPEDPNRSLLTPSISPSFVIAAGRLVLSPRSMFLKNELKRLYDGEDVETESALAARQLEIPIGTRSMLLFDWADQVGTLLSFLPLLALGLPELPFRLDQLPSAEEIKRSFPPVFGYSVPGEKGTRHHYQSAVGFDFVVGGLRLFANLPPQLRSLLPF